MKEDFLDYLENIKNYSDNTIVSYNDDLDKFYEFINSNNLNIKNIKYKEILDFISYLKTNHKSTSINRVLSTIRSFYNYLIKQGYINNNPFKIVSGMKQEKKLPEYFKYNEYVELLNSIDTSNVLGIRNKCIFEVLLATGCRVSELVNIKLSDIDLNNQEIRVLGKGKKVRIVYLGSYAVDSINDYLSVRNELLKNKGSAYLFLNHLGNKITTRGIRDIIDKILLKSSSNLKITPHTFRHSFATMMLNEGCDLKSVQELLGHVSLSTTSIYTHVSNEELKRVYLHTNPRK